MAAQAGLIEFAASLGIDTDDELLADAVCLPLPGRSPPSPLPPRAAPPPLSALS